MTTTNKCSILKDVVAYVDVWSSDKTANYSKPFIQQLQEMGAQVSKTFNKQVTHVVFNNGHLATWRKARKSNVRLVSVLWVGRCFDDGVHVDEELYPALDETNPVLKNKKHRCMQPKDSPERTPENDRRMKKKLDKMMKDLVPKQLLDTDVSPIIIDEANGIVYSPAFKRSDYMAQRLKDMKEKHENLSPTASQMVQSGSPAGLKPSLGSTPTVLKLTYDQSDDDSSASVAEPAYSPDKEEERTLRNVTDHCHLKRRQRKSSETPGLSPCHDVPKQIPTPLKFPDFIDKEDEDGNTPKKSRRTSVRKKPAEKHKSMDIQESPSQDRRSDKSKNFQKEKKRSHIKSCSPSPNRAEKGKRNVKVAKSFTETMPQSIPNAVTSPSCQSSPSGLGKAVVELSKENSTTFQKMEQKTPKKARPSLSSMVRSFTPSGDSKSVVLGSTKEDDDVFEDFFSPVNRHQKSKQLLLPNLPVEKDIQIPFELDSGPKKRKQRRSESLGSETNSQKKKKLEKNQRGKNCDKQFDESSEPQSPSQQDVKQSLPVLDSSSSSVTHLAKGRRQNTLQLQSTSTTSNAVKQRGTSASSTSTIFKKTNTVLKLQQNSDVHVLAHTLEDDQSDGSSSASVAEPAYSLDKGEGVIQSDVTDHTHLERYQRKSSETPGLSPRHDVPKRIPTPLKCPNFIDKEDEDGNTPKKSKRTSVRKEQTEKHKSMDIQESPSQDRRFNNNENFQKETRRSHIKSCSSLPNRAAKGKPKFKAAKSFTDTMPQFIPNAVTSPLSCFSSPSEVGNAVVEQSKESSTVPQQEMEQKTCKRAIPLSSLSSMVRSFTPPDDNKSVVSGSTDRDDNVFEDYFSPVNHQKSKRPLLPNLPVEKDIQIPFELGSGPKKRKQRRSESLGSETNSQKKKKLEKSQRGKNCNQQFDESSEPQSPSQHDTKQYQSALHSSSANVTLSKRERQNTLQLQSTSTTSNAVKQRGTSASSTSTKFVENNTVSKLQQSTDVTVLSHTLESGGNECRVAAGSTEIPSEGEYHNKQVSLSLQKMVNKAKAMRTLVMTSMPTEKQHIVGQLVKTLGGFAIVDRVCESTTHVVSGGHRRTLNILLGIARGCWILSFEWILWCLEQRQWIPEEPYELSDQFPAAQICRLQRHLSAGEHQQDLFQSQPAMFVSQHSQPPTQSLVELIQLCGGTVCKTVRQAGICIGKYTGRRPEGSRILSEQWVLDSITHLKQLSYDNYDLE